MSKSSPQSARKPLYEIRGSRTNKLVSEVVCYNRVQTYVMPKYNMVTHWTSHSCRLVFDGH